MSRLGGFDFVCQIRRDKLLNLMVDEQNGLTVQGNSLATPFRLSIEGPRSGFPPRRSNTVDLVVKSVDLALQVGTNLCTLILHLEGGVIRLPGAPDAAFTGGAVNVQMQLVDGTFIVVRIVRATLDAPATAVNAGIANFAARANSEVDKLINAERNKDVDIYPDAGLIKQILVIFSKNKNLDADTFCAHIGGNDAGTLTSTLGLKTSVSYAISAGIVIAQLPTAEQLSQPHVTITEVNYVFRDGGIDVNGKFDGHDTCWSVSGGSFSQSLIPSLMAQNFVFTPDPPSNPTPRLDFHLELNYLCMLGKAAIDFIDFAFTQAFFCFMDRHWPRLWGYMEVSFRLRPLHRRDRDWCWEASLGTTSKFRRKDSFFWESELAAEWCRQCSSLQSIYERTMPRKICTPWHKAV